MSRRRLPVPRARVATTAAPTKPNHRPTSPLTTTQAGGTCSCRQLHDVRRVARGRGDGVQQDRCWPPGRRRTRPPRTGATPLRRARCGERAPPHRPADSPVVRPGAPAPAVPPVGTRVVGTPERSGAGGGRFAPDDNPGGRVGCWARAGRGRARRRTVGVPVVPGAPPSCGSSSSEPGAVLAIRRKVSDHPARRDPGHRVGAAGVERNAHAERQNEPAFPCAMRAWSGAWARTMEK